MNTSVTVVICVRNDENYLGKCIESLLNQTYTDFTLVLINDASSDKTEIAIKKFDDKRIKYFKNEERFGIAKSRNRGIASSRGEYIFFTDGDCIISKDWIEQGIKYLKDPNCVGVEGKIVYVSEDYEPSFSDHVCENYYGGQFTTGNIAYKRRVIESVGGFDERYNYHEDRDLGLRVMKHGKIRFNPNMIVYVQQETRTPKKLIEKATHVKDKVLLYKKFREKRDWIVWRIVYPLNLAIALFPPLVSATLLFFFSKFRKLDDFKLLPFVYVYVIYERLQLWKECAKQRVFLI
jgi:glycosyltransferase involved in cell wall biosynthesis